MFKSTKIPKCLKRLRTNISMYIYTPHSSPPIPKCHGEGSHELAPKIAHGLYRMDPQKTYQKHVFATKQTEIAKRALYIPP